MIIKYITIVLLVIALVSCSSSNNQPIKIGVLHSLTGTMAFSERDLVDAVTLAVEQINASGGVLGRPLQTVVVDGASDTNIFTSAAEHLITQDKVPVIFGCWTSTCRKAVKLVVEKHDHLLFYPLQYEGMEQSPNIIYTGAAPNQQIVPSVRWAIQNLGTRIYLVGSDYIFPRTANMIIKDLLNNAGIQPLGEYYLAKNTNDVSTLINEIKQLKPDLILNTINGDANMFFFEELDKHSDAAVLSYSISESEIQQIGANLMSGHYAVWNYFQSVNSAESNKFVTAFKARFGEHRVLNDPMEAAYIGVYLWSQAVNAAGTITPSNVRAMLGYQSFNAPEGVVSIDAETQHLWKTVRIGQIREDGQFKVVWSSGVPIRPAPFPSYHDKNKWRKRISVMKLEANHE